MSLSTTFALVMFSIWYVHTIGLKGKKDIKSLNTFKQEVK